MLRLYQYCTVRNETKQRTSQKFRNDNEYKQHHIKRDKLSWLRAGEHVDFKLHLLVYKVVHRHAPKNIATLFLSLLLLTPASSRKWNENVSDSWLCQRTWTSALIHRWKLDHARDKYTVWSTSIFSCCCKFLEQSTNQHQVINICHRFQKCSQKSFIY